jgi:hypothetical protein
LDNAGLSHKVLIDLIPQLTRSKSLISVHLGFNPGIDEQLFRIIMRKLRAKKPPKHVLNIEIKKMGNISPRTENLYQKEGI